MRKIFLVLMAVVLLISLTACGKPVSYVPSEQIEVALAFVDEQAVVVTRKLMEQELKTVELACCYYTADGSRIGTYSLVECDFSTQDTLSVWNFEAPEQCEYMEAVIASVTYPNGKKKACEGVGVWGESRTQINPQAYEETIQEMRELQGVEAKKCPAASISVGALEEGKQKLEITAGDQPIKDLTLYVLWYDEEGMPLDSGGAFVKNAESITSGGLQAQQTGSYSAEAPAGAAKAKIIIRNINFEDGTTWENAYFYEWAFVNYKKTA